MDELPELPFELVLSYLSLEDVIKSRAVSRVWKLKTDNYRVKTLCCSERLSGFIWRKGRLVSGAFAQNFISSTRCISFFNTFGHSILSNLKHLRICHLELEEENEEAFDEEAFDEALNSFGQLEMLDITRSHFPHPDKEFNLSLPMLKSIRLERFSGIDRLTLDAPRLQKVRIDDRLKRMDLVHVECVEKVTINRFGQMPVKHLKNLKQLYVRYSSSSIDPTLLSGLEQLKEVHLDYRVHVPELFDQKQRYGRDDLKVYLSGLFLSGPEDPIIGFFSYFHPELFVHWAENPLRLADEIPFYSALHYAAIERVAPEVAINIVNRFTDLGAVFVNGPVQDVPRFLGFLKNFHNIVELHFKCDQPQDLFDRLPEHCAVQKLTIHHLAAPPDAQFLPRLKHLMYLFTGSIEVECIRRILEELEFISFIRCRTNKKWVKIDIDQLKRYLVLIEGTSSKSLPDVNAVIEFIAEKTSRGC